MPGADPFNERPGLGIHYHKNYLTPYWDAEGGVALDATYQYGFRRLDGVPVRDVDHDVGRVRVEEPPAVLGLHGVEADPGRGCVEILRERWELLRPAVVPCR